MSRSDKKILVVDDEPDVRDYLAAILMDAGFQVRTASDGEEALEMIRSDPPDFISLDLLMPRRSGRRLLYALQKDRQLARIPVLIVTAHARDHLGQDELSQLLESRILSGPGAYLEKPVNPAELIRCVERALNLEPMPQVAESEELRRRIEQRLESAEPEALRRALVVLGKSIGKG
ncbi:MAG: response regulator [Acidobacteriota bacterium]|jgi:CheY-like chemotaxis protein